MLGGLLKKFLGIGRSEGGNVLIIVAFASVILITAIGAAIDFSRTSIANQNQQVAVDIAERAANNYCTNASNAATSDAAAMQKCVTAQVNKYYNANINKGIAGSTIGKTGSSETSTLTTNGNDALVSVNAASSINSSLVKSKSGEKTVPIQTNLAAGADNTAWKGVCDSAHKGVCLVGTSDWTSGTTWNCTGQNGGAQTACSFGSVTTNGSCGTNAGACGDGTTQTVAGGSWTCPGTNKSANCTIGACQSSPTAANQCTSGIAISSLTTGTTTTWVCQGSNVSLNSTTCTYNGSTNGSCGTSAGACGDGSIQAVTNYSWICPGTGTGSSSAICNIGTCSSSPITANQCTSGIASSLTTGTTTTWVCQGSNVSLNSGVCSYTPPNSSEGICDTTFNKCIYGTSINQDEASKTWQCKGEAGNAANCSITTNGECGTEDNGAGSCAAGTVQDYVQASNGSGATWNCVGTSCGYTASCGSVYGKCGAYSGVIPTPSNASSGLGICASGSATILENQFNSSAGFQKWECNGTGGKVTGSGNNNQNAVSCTNSTCNNPPSASAYVACEPIYTNNAHGTTQENYSCNATTGILDTIDTSTSCTSKTANCTGTPTPLVSVSVCPSPYYSSGLITTTIPYSCVKGKPNAQLLEGAKTVSNTCVQATPTCVAGNKRTVACDSTEVNFTGSKTQIEECPNGDFGTPTWYDNDTSACAVNGSVCTNSKAVSCQTIYGANYYDNSTTNPQLGVTETQSCSYNGGTVSCGNWTLPTTPPANCVACASMNINYWVRTSTSTIAFNSGNNNLHYTLYGESAPLDEGVVNCSTNTNKAVNFTSNSEGIYNTAGCITSNVVHNSTYSVPGGGVLDWWTCAGVTGDISYGTFCMTMSANTLINGNGKNFIGYRAYKSANPSVDANNSYEVSQCPSSYFVLLEYNIASPLKVNIAGGNAKLNSDRSIQFSQTQKDGSKKIITTYGSLNPDEAWLMLDRDGEGLINNGVINGDNFFTDHDGVKNDAYHDLAKTFALFVKTDENGHNYIPLHKITEQEKLDEIEDKKIRVDKRIGAVREMVPSYHLKLLDANNNEFYASDYFDRIYVEKRDVSVADEIHKNIILEIAPVRTLDGKYHLSADQWFVPKQ